MIGRARPPFGFVERAKLDPLSGQCRMAHVDTGVDHAETDALTAGGFGRLPAHERTRQLVAEIFLGLGLELVIGVDQQTGEAGDKLVARRFDVGTDGDTKPIKVHGQRAQAHPFDHREAHVADKGVEPGWGIDHHQLIGFEALVREVRPERRPPGRHARRRPLGERRGAVIELGYRA